MDRADDVALLRLLREGDECAFGALVARYRATMLRIALHYIPDRAIAEEAVQDAWIGILSGLRRFEGRSSLKTWLFSIVSNRAKTNALRETRALPLSLLAISPEGGSDELLRSPDRFLWRDDDGEFSRHWNSTSQHWEHLPEEHAEVQETVEYTRRAIACLAPTQRQVLILRDIEGWTSADVCRQLHITVSNQRVLLHRARAHVRDALERYFEDDNSAST
jgi:RNA polymerase sigma-70 factor (ECF subfamily)